MKTAFALLAILVAALGLVACGDDDDDDTGAATTPVTTEATGGGGGGETLTVTADETGQLAWEPTELSAKAGQVTIELDNPSAVSHDVEIEGNGVEEKSDLVSEGTATVTADLTPGSYRYYCTVPGHADAGMDGTLTVK